MYYSSIPVAEFVRVMMEMQKRGIVSGDAPGDREAMEALPRSEPNCIVDVSDQYDKKNAALRAHLTQLDTFGPFTNMPDDLARSFFSREYFYRAVPPLKDGEMLDDLFAQLA